MLNNGLSFVDRQQHFACLLWHHRLFVMSSQYDVTTVCDGLNWDNTAGIFMFFMTGWSLNTISPWKLYTVGVQHYGYKTSCAQFCQIDSSEAWNIPPSITITAQS